MGLNIYFKFLCDVVFANTKSINCKDFWAWFVFMIQVRWLWFRAPGGGPVWRGAGPCDYLGISPECGGVSWSQRGHGKRADSDIQIIWPLSMFDGRPFPPPCALELKLAITGCGQEVCEAAAANIEASTQIDSWLAWRKMKSDCRVKEERKEKWLGGKRHREWHYGTIQCTNALKISAVFNLNQAIFNVPIINVISKKKSKFDSTSNIFLILTQNHALINTLVKPTT